MTRNALFYLCLVILTLLAESLAYASTCSKYVGACEYYLCKEQTDQCGQRGYYLDFAYKYCVKYKKSESKYSELGQIFISNIRRCLQDELETAQLDRKTNSCKDIKKYAINTHKSCYSKYRFCELSYADQWRVKYTAKSALLDPAILGFALYLEKSCL
ncbi:MAG: hypothetical protein ACK41T_08075 [Pseudobdellovibrio sp.]